MQTLVITGTDSGIGLATAKRFLDEGWRVIGTHLASDSPIAHPHFIGIPLDLTQPDMITAACDAILARTPSIDALINNAGILNDAFEERPDMANLRTTLDINLVGAIDFTERLLDRVADGGHILNISSRLGSFTEPQYDAAKLGYRISKAGLNMYTRTLARRLHARDIIVTSMHPGWVKTTVGQAVATETTHPDRAPEEAAADIFALITDNKKSDAFLFRGKTLGW